MPALGNTHFFTGRQYDADTGLYYYRHRWYDPVHGRFLTRDPLGVWGDPRNLGNPYTYAGNNPWSYVDPYGLEGCGQGVMDSVGGAFFDSVDYAAGLGESALDLFWWASEPVWFAGENALIGSGGYFVGEYENQAERASILLEHGPPGLLAHDVSGGIETLQYITDPRNNAQSALAYVRSPDDLTAYGERFLGFKAYTDPEAFWQDAGNQGTAVGMMLVTDRVAGNVGGISPSRASLDTSPVLLGPSRLVQESTSGSAKLCLNKRPGRLGSSSTRQQNADIATELKGRGWTITFGGGKPEEYINSATGGRKGSAWVDITATKNGRTMRVNTVDTRADGVTPSTREAKNATRIRSLKPKDHLLLIPKKK